MLSTFAAIVILFGAYVYLRRHPKQAAKLDQWIVTVPKPRGTSLG